MEQNIKRNKEIARRARKETYEQVGKDYGLTRERVRQIMRLYYPNFDRSRIVSLNHKIAAHRQHGTLSTASI